LTIVTKDSDFNDICTLRNFPPHIIWLRLGNSGLSEVERVLLFHKKHMFDIIENNKTGIIEIKS
jgi:predicted nuclease of predicted toxin-antitoxin system